MTSTIRRQKKQDKRILPKKLMAVILLAIMMVLTMAPATYAYEKIDMEQQATLAVQFANGPKVSGMEFRAYKIANVDENANFSFVEAIATYGLAMPADQAGYRELAETLSAYVARDGITPAAKAITDGDGYAYFGKLDMGLYLVLASEYKDAEGTTYIVLPSLVALPNSTNGITWNYDVTVSPKYSTAPPLPSTGGETTDINVIKVWSGEANKDKRPTFVYAELICDGAVIDTITLNSGNNWRHTWTDLDASKTYSVTEKDVPMGYTVTITRDGNTFTLNNYSGDIPPATPKTPKLPNTGQLWWPVPILVIAGITLMVIGRAKKRTARSTAS